MTGGPTEPEVESTEPTPHLPPPDLVAFKLHDQVPELVPAEPGRGWMDASADRFAYRCIPLSIANGTGWELLSPYDFSATWSGGMQTKDIRITADQAEWQAHVDTFAQSHFGEAVLTLHPGYLFRTPPGWALWVRGAPNQPVDGIYPLDGIVETDWLPFTFTMNWRFTRPGTVRFRKGDRFCFITPVPHGTLGDVQPRIRSIKDEPELLNAFNTWSESRASFNDRLRQNDPDTVKEGWQRHYVRGDAQGAPAPGYHVSKRRMKPPIVED